MNLIEKKTGERLNGVIEKVSKSDLKRIKKEKNFGFDWNLEADNQLYKIRLAKSKEILGIISLIDYPKEFRIHINLIESSKKYRGKDKSILNIPGCLIAFACKMAFKNGYEGFVSLTPKTELVEYYNKTYGFLQFGTQVAVLEEISESLIQKYIGDEEI